MRQCCVMAMLKRASGAHSTERESRAPGLPGQPCSLLSRQKALPPFLKAWLFIIFQVFVLFLPSSCQVQMKFFEPLLLQACG